MLTLRDLLLLTAPLVPQHRMIEKLADIEFESTLI